MAVLVGCHLCDGQGDKAAADIERHGGFHDRHRLARSPPLGLRDLCRAELDAPRWSDIGNEPKTAS